MTPYLIGITGGSGSGKSTLADALKLRLGDEQCTLLEEDHYYKARTDQAGGAETWSLEEVEANVNFDATTSKDMALMTSNIAALKRGETIRQPIYDFATHDRVAGESVTVRPTPVIIVEGIHVLSEPELADLFDLKIYVDTPDDLRLSRRILRDVIPKSEGGRGRSVDRVISQYLKFVRASHHRFTEPAKFICDLVIADEGLPAYGNACPSKAAIDRMVAPVMAQIPKAVIKSIHRD